MGAVHTRIHSEVTITSKMTIQVLFAGFSRRKLPDFGRLRVKIRNLYGNCGFSVQHIQPAAERHSFPEEIFRHQNNCVHVKNLCSLFILFSGALTAEVVTSIRHPGPHSGPHTHTHTHTHTLEVTHGQISSQSPTYATSSRWQFYGS